MLLNKDELVRKLFDANAHFGYSKTKRHPSTEKYIYGRKNRKDIINLEETAKQMEKALEFIKEIASQSKTLLFVGTKAGAKLEIKVKAASIKCPYIEERWIGGTLTNFFEIQKRIKMLNDLQQKQLSGELVYKTKKEKLLLERKINRLKKMFSGIKELEKKPDALCVIDPKKEHIAVSEAKKIGIPVIALANTDCDLTNIDYPVVASDNSVSTIKLFLDYAAKFYQDNKA